MEGFLKKVKLNESTISMVLGIMVIAVVGILVVNYFNSTKSGDTSSDATSTEVNVTKKIYVVQPGDNLSTIADKQYGDKLKWLAIAKANNITNPNLLEKGQELVIPTLDEVAGALTSREGELSPTTTIEVTLTTTLTPTETEVVDNSPTSTPEPTATPTPDPTATSIPEVTMTPSPTESVEPINEDTQSKTYEVQSGDSLWSIASNVYGDGYRWVDIAKANDLANPNVIHHGNVLVLPQ